MSTTHPPQFNDPMDAVAFFLGTLSKDVSHIRERIDEGLAAHDVRLLVVEHEISEPKPPKFLTSAQVHLFGLVERIVGWGAGVGALAAGGTLAAKLTGHL